MSVENQSLESLFAQLTSFSVEQDAEFRRGDSDTLTRIRKVGRFVGTVYDEELEQEIPLYDEKSSLLQPNAS